MVCPVELLTFQKLGNCYLMVNRPVPLCLHIYSSIRGGFNSFLVGGNFHKQCCVLSIMVLQGNVCLLRNV